MGRLFLSVIFLYFYNISFSQISSSDYNWSVSFGGTQYNGVDVLATDIFGNVIAAGRFSGTVDFDPSPITNFPLTAQGNNEIFITKQTPQGELIWVKSIGGNGLNIATSLVTDSSGNIYISGYFQGSGDFNPGDDEFILTSAGDDDIFIVKLDVNGNFVWGGGMGSTAKDRANSIAIDSDDNLYITGHFRHSFDVDLGSTSYMIHAVSFDDTFVLKMDADSNLLWAKTFEGVTNMGNKIAIDSQNYVYVSGIVIGGPVDFDPSGGVFHLSATGNSRDAYVCKLDSNGNFVTAGITGGINIASIPSFNSMKFDSMGNLIIAGKFSGTVDFDLTAGQDFQVVTHTTPDVFILKTDPNLNTIWFRQMGGNLEAAALTLEIDSQDNIYTSGYYTDSFMDFDPDPNVFRPELHNSMEEVFVSVLDQNGLYVDVFSMRGSGNERGNQLVFDNDENLYLAGYFEYNFSLFSHFSLQSQGDKDSYILKLGNNPTTPPANFPPIANDDFSEIVQGGSVLIDLALNDIDPESNLDLSSITIVTVPKNGTITIHNNGTVTYSHDNSETSEDSFQYTIKDADGATSNVALVTISILPPLRIDDFENNKYVLYPNPASTIVNVNEKATRIIVYNLSGKEVLVTNETSFDISPFVTGVYIVKIENDYGIQSLLLIKK